MIATKPATTFLPLLSGKRGQEGTHTLTSLQQMPTHLPPLAIPSVPEGEQDKILLSPEYLEGGEQALRKPGPPLWHLL